MKMLTALFVSAFTLTGLSYAEDVTTIKANAETTNGQTPAAIGSRAEASGKIISVKTIDLAGMAEDHVFAKLKGDDGEVDIIDLGNAAELKAAGLDPKEGQQLFVSGRIGRINDKEMIMAEAVSESKLVSITRKNKLREESQKHADKRQAEGGADTTAVKSERKETVDTTQVKTVEGVVMNSRKLMVEGQKEEHMIVKLQSDEGIVILDLGPVSSLPKVDLSENQSIAATGFVGSINDKPLIVADSVGNLSTIKRETAAAK